MAASGSGYPLIFLDKTLDFCSLPYRTILGHGLPESMVCLSQWSVAISLLEGKAAGRADSHSPDHLQWSVTQAPGSVSEP